MKTGVFCAPNYVVNVFNLIKIKVLCYIHTVCLFETDAHALPPEIYYLCCRIPKENNLELTQTLIITADHFVFWSLGSGNLMSE